jgi:4-carboxymuconolactone decarboxylase
MTTDIAADGAALRRAAAAAVALLASAGAAWAQVPVAPERMGPVPPSAYDAAQKQAAEDFEKARKTGVFGPFSRMMRSPEVMSSARSMGDYLRFGSAIGTTLSEFVILVTAREWTQEYEWSLHAPIALQRGIKPEVVQALAEGRRPETMSEDEALCYDFLAELHRNKQVSDATYARAVKRFGEKGVIDLTAISGYYTFLAMQLNMMRAAPEPGGPLLKKFPE